jgi:hypothetical protein
VTSGNLWGRRENVSPVGRHNPEVSPSAILESTRPMGKGAAVNVRWAVMAIPSVESGGHKICFDNRLEDGIGKDYRPRLLTPLQFSE